MGFQVSQNGGNSRRRRASTPLAEINVTPFVDVMLVLLIIFMVAAPMMSKSIDVKLPQTDAKATQTSEQVDPLIISITDSGEIYLGKEQVSEQQLKEKVKAAVATNSELYVRIKGSKKTEYDNVARVAGILTSSGVTKMGLMTE